MRISVDASISLSRYLFDDIKEFQTERELSKELNERVHLREDQYARLKAIADHAQFAIAQLTADLENPSLSFERRKVERTKDEISHASQLLLRHLKYEEGYIGYRV